MWREKGLAAFAEQLARLQPPARMSSAFQCVPFSMEEIGLGVEFKYMMGLN